VRARVQNTLQTDTALFKQAHFLFFSPFLPFTDEFGYLFYFIILFDLASPSRGRHKLYIFWMFFGFFLIFFLFFTPIVPLPTSQTDSHDANKVNGNLYNAPEKEGNRGNISQPRVLHCPRRDKWAEEMPKPSDHPARKWGKQ